MRLWITLALSFLSTCLPGVVNSQVVYNEIVSGDLGDPINAAPTDLGVLGLGVNTVSGSLDNTFSILDRDAFTFNVAVGQQLDSLSFTNLQGEDRFYALSNQDTALSTSSANGNYYASLVGAGSIGTNLLDGTVNNLRTVGSGQSGPLGAGEYSFWLQETDFSVVGYSLSLSTSTAVPEPGATCVLFISGGLMGLRRRRTGW